MYLVSELLAMADDSSLDPAPLPAGARVREVRNDAGICSTDLAAAVGVTDRTIGNYEMGRTSKINSSAAKLRLGRILAALAA